MTFRVPVLGGSMRRPFDAAGWLILHAAAPVFGWSSAPRKIAGGVDDRNVRQCLREIADETSSSAIVFLGQQSNVIAEREQSLEQRHGVRLSAGER